MFLQAGCPSNLSNSVKALKGQLLDPEKLIYYSNFVTGNL